MFTDKDKIELDQRVEHITHPCLWRAAIMYSNSARVLSNATYAPDDVPRYRYAFNQMMRATRHMDWRCLALEIASQAKPSMQASVMEDIFRIESMQAWVIERLSDRLEVSPRGTRTRLKNPDALAWDHYAEDEKYKPPFLSSNSNICWPRRLFRKAYSVATFFAQTPMPT